MIFRGLIFGVLFFFTGGIRFPAAGASLQQTAVPAGATLPGAADTLVYASPASAGLNADSLHKINDLLQEAIKDSVFPGAVAAVMKDGKLVYNHAAGYHTYNKKTLTKRDDIFDLASITKIMSTTLAVMKLTDEGRLNPEDEVRNYIPEYDTDEKKHIRIKDFLLHQSGLPAFQVYVDSLQTRRELLEAIRREPLTYQTGTQYIYSDLGMILLADIVEGITGERIDEYVGKSFYEPMGMTSTFFNPRSKGNTVTARVHPTEIDTVFGRGLVHAAVHDERAYFMDGVAGHAGLFSNTTDMAKYASLLLSGGVYNGVRYLKPETVDLFTSKQSEISGRGYGFDRKSETGFSTAGASAGKNTFGHLGFTGTSIWIDKDKNMAVILLTNRVNPYRSYGSRMAEFRARIAGAAFSSIN